MKKMTLILGMVAMGFLSGVWAAEPAKGGGDATANSSAQAKKGNAGGGAERQVVVFYFDAQHRPVTKLERLEPLSEGIKAILAMYALQVGGGCEGDDGTGLKCELTQSLGLGAQCSEQHLNLVRSWFKGKIPSMHGYPERTVQRALQSGDLQTICYNAPEGATHQETWQIIRVKKKNDLLYVNAISSWTAGSDGPSGQHRYATVYRIIQNHVIVVAHKKLQ